MHICSTPAVRPALRAARCDLRCMPAILTAKSEATHQTRTVGGYQIAQIRCDSRQSLSFCLHCLQKPTRNSDKKVGRKLRQEGRKESYGYGPPPCRCRMVEMVCGVWDCGCTSHPPAGALGTGVGYFALDVLDLPAACQLHSRPSWPGHFGGCASISPLQHRLANKVHIWRRVQILMLLSGEMLQD